MKQLYTQEVDALEQPEIEEQFLCKKEVKTISVSQIQVNIFAEKDRKSTSIIPPRLWFAFSVKRSNTNC